MDTFSFAKRRFFDTPENRYLRVNFRFIPIDGMDLLDPIALGGFEIRNMISYRD